MHAYIQILLYKQIHPYIHAYVSTYVHTYMHTLHNMRTEPNTWGSSYVLPTTDVRIGYAHADSGCILGGALLSQKPYSVQH